MKMNMKKLTMTMAAALTAATVFGARTNFDLDWEFALKDYGLSFGKVGLTRPQNNANDNGTPRVVTDTNGWTKVDLPHDWALGLPLAAKGSRNGFRAVGKGFPENSVGWYRKRFKIPETADGSRVFLQFDGVYRDAMFWVNGVYLGRNDSGYIGRRFEITDVLKYGTKDNIVAVRVNATADEGWWYDGAGINRHVWLDVRPADGLVPDSVRISLKELKDAAAVMHVDYETFTDGKAAYDFTVENPHLWSPDDPHLYTLELKGETFTYGIRTVVFDPNRGLLINGRRVPVNGVCCHQDHAGVGTAVPDGILDYRIRRLKAMGVNGYRTSHNPPSPELLDACDRYGIVVMDEQRFFSASDEGLDQLRRLILRDRNHPSVVAWSFGNEEHNVQNDDLGRRMALRMRKLQRELDPTRVCTYGGNNGQNFEGVNEVVDVRGVNYVRLMREGKAKQMGCGLDDYHAAHPNQPIWGSEEASTLTTRGAEDRLGLRLVMPDADQPSNRPLGWALTAEEWTTFCAERDWFAGAFAWTGFDYRGECRWPATICNFGILDLCGYGKNNFHYYRARWTDEDVLHVYPHWNQPRTNLWVNTNCEEVELFVNGRSVGRQKRDAKTFRLNFPVSYEPGAVVAKGLRQGREVTFRMATSGAVRKLKLVADRTRLNADGRDATVVDVIALDAAGNEVPDACGPVNFSFSGAGRIVGVGNGDPMSHEDDVCKDDEWTRRLFNGRCQLAVKGARNPGTLTVEAWLTPAEKFTLRIPVGVAAADAEIDLSGTWKLAKTDDPSVTCPMTVPGDTHSALLAAKLMPDPYWGCNETNVQWAGRADWTVSRTFSVSPELLAKKEIVLRLEDCDTFCTVKVNGQVVGRTSDRFKRYDFDVKPFLKAGENRIEGFFESAERIGNERRAAFGRAYPMTNVQWAKNHALVRKPACHGGWDWGPALMYMGFCGTTKILASDRPRIDYLYTAQAFNDDFSHCTLTVFADMSDGTTVTNTVEIDNPPLWWPHGAGEQRFYEYEVEVGGQRLKGRVGLRKIEIVNTPDVDAKGKKGARMAVKVNGRELFMKGANWIPCDAFESRQTVARYRNLLESAAAANMNMIRLWGGGQFEHDAFYDICDELGILVWHDQMFSCAVYPADEAFLKDVRDELAHQIRRLRDHASIALWCGDNECVGALKWFPETNKDPQFYREALLKRHAVQDEMVAKYDPARMFWPSSPCAGPGNFADNWKNDSQGDMHNWQVWHDNRPFDAYYAYSPRFCSEFGYQSFPSPEVAETFATREQILSRAPEFEWHQKNTGGNRRIRETMLRYFQPPKDVPAELLLSQFQQGMAIKMGVDGWRAQRPRCMGTLFWQLNDNWPVASWSSIEYGGKWKPLHYLAKRFFEPVAVVAQPEIVDRKANVRRGRIFALNDTAETVKGELLVEYWTYDGKIACAERKSVTLPPDSSTDVGAFEGQRTKDNGQRPETFLVLTLTTSRGTYQNDWHFGFFKDMPLAKANVRLANASGEAESLPLVKNGNSITLVTDAPAFYVWANMTKCPGEFDDNCLTLLPGRPRTLRFGGNFNPKALSVTHLAELGK